MSNFNTWVVTSTINATNTAVDSNHRFEQTIDTLKSIKSKDPSAAVLVLDNSIDYPDRDKIGYIKSLCDIYYQHKHDIFSSLCNLTGYNKSIGEVLLMAAAGALLSENRRLVGRRFFKISGRYKLSDQFNVDLYLDKRFDDKFAFKTAVWWFKNTSNPEDVVHKSWLETQLWSCSTSLLEYYFNSILPQSLLNMLEHKDNIELSYIKLIPVDKIVLLPELNLTGIRGNDGQLVTL